MDDIDRVLVAELQQNGRQTFAELARLVGLSPPAVHDRVAKLEAAGVITGYTAQVDPATLGMGVTALVGVFQSANCDTDALADRLNGISEIETCWSISGEEAFQLLVRVCTVAELEKVIGRIRRIDGVARTRTTVVLTTKWHHRPIPLASTEELS